MDTGTNKQGIAGAEGFWTLFLLLIWLGYVQALENPGYILSSPSFSTEKVNHLHHDCLPN
jgi:hypothetical protein